MLMPQPTYQIKRKKEGLFYYSALETLLYSIIFQKKEKYNRRFIIYNILLDII